MSMNVPTAVHMNEELKVPLRSTAGEVPPDPLAAHLCVIHKSQVEAQLSRSFSRFLPVNMKVSVAAGATYEIKVDVNNGEFINLKVFVPQHGHGGSCLVGVKQTVTVNR